MRDFSTFYIGGHWVEPAVARFLDVENPATERVVGRISAGSDLDVDRAARAARHSFSTWSQSTIAERLDLIEVIIREYERRAGELSATLTEEMGAPTALATNSQVPLGVVHFNTAREALKDFTFSLKRGTTLIVREPIGVCALITPWNWPLHQIACKVAPAIATGCTMILKPSEIAPFSGQIFAEIMDAAGVPAGVFNMIQGDGMGVGIPLCTHPEIDMVSFTGSTRAGIEVAKNAAATVKRVTQELGGKSANILVDDDGFAAAVKRGVAAAMNNSGQSCNAPTRMLVPHALMDETAAIAAEMLTTMTLGPPETRAVLGPVVSSVQFAHIQRLIQSGIESGAMLIGGGLGKPDGQSIGYFVRPTVFARVTNDMEIAREEIFGPVLSIIGYASLDEAVDIANDSDFGLAAYVQAKDPDLAEWLATRLRAGQVSINGAWDASAPFGGYKMSGNGREWGEIGFSEFLETKAILGMPSDLTHLSGDREERSRAAEPS